MPLRRVLDATSSLEREVPEHVRVVGDARAVHGRRTDVQYTGTVNLPNLKMCFLVGLQGRGKVISGHRDGKAEGSKVPALGVAPERHPVGTS